MATTFGVVLSGTNSYVVGARQADAGRALAPHVDDTGDAACKLEPGHYLDIAGGLVAATPELAARAISWSRG